MSTEITYFLILVGAVVIVALSLIIFRQVRTSKAIAKKQAQEQAQYAAEAAKQRDYVLDSSRLIATAILNDDKITLTEGCIRLKVMLDNINPQMHLTPEYSVFEEVYNRTSHIPFLTGWRELDRKQQRAFEKEMRALEQECEGRINQAAKLLLQDPVLKTH